MKSKPALANSSSICFSWLRMAASISVPSVFSTYTAVMFSILMPSDGTEKTLAFFVKAIITQYIKTASNGTHVPSDKERRFKVSTSSSLVSPSSSLRIDMAFAKSILLASTSMDSLMLKPSLEIVSSKKSISFSSTIKSASMRSDNMRAKAILCTLSNICYLLQTSIPTIPTSIKRAKNIFNAENVSPKSHIPITKVPMAPSPVHTI